MNTEQPNQKETRPRELETILVDPEKSLALRHFLQILPGTEEHADFWTQAVAADLRKPLDGIGLHSNLLASFREAQAVKPAPAPTHPEQGPANPHPTIRLSLRKHFLNPVLPVFFGRSPLIPHTDATRTTPVKTPPP